MADRKYKISTSPRFEAVVKNLNKRKPSVLKELYKKIDKVVYKPNLGKPLGNVLKNKRRIHVGSFVLLYEFIEYEVRLLDFDHHDKIYKKSK